MGQICIITPYGMKCASSPVVVYDKRRRKFKREPDHPGRERKAAAMARALGLDPKRTAVLTKVLRLLLLEGYDPTQPFCLISKGS